MTLQLPRLPAAAAVLVLVTGAAAAEEIVGVTSDGRLVSFDSATPALLTSERPVTGVPGQIVAMDVRPADDEIYVVTADSRLYRIDRRTGAGTVVGAPSRAFASPLGGGAGMAFDPIGDRIRIVNSRGRNLRLAPSSATVVDGDPVQVGVQEDARLAFAESDVNARVFPTVAAIARESATVNAVSADYFGIDTFLNALVILGPADEGVLHTVGPLGVTAQAVAGFDVSERTGIAFAAITQRGQPASALYTIDLRTGLAAPIGLIGAGATLAAMSIGPETAGDVPSTQLIGLTQSGDLVRFRSEAPDVVTRRTTVTGLAPGETLLAIDTRPSNGRLYGLGSTGRVYALNAGSGVAAAIRPEPFDVPLAGAVFGFDFNPQSSRIRVTSDDGQSFRVDPDTGAVLDADDDLPGTQVDRVPVFVAGDVNHGRALTLDGVAFGPAVSGGPVLLFGIDTSLGTLVRIGTASGGLASQNAGQVHTIGSLNAALPGVPYGQFAGFEIARRTAAFAAFRTPGATTRLYVVDLETGAAAPLGGTGLPEQLVDVAVAPTSNPRPHAEGLDLSRFTLRLDFGQTGDDGATIQGSLPFEGSIPMEGRTATIDVGGFTRTFVLARNGSSRDDAGTRTARDDDSFSLATDPVDGRIRFVVHLRREALAAALADEGLTGDANVGRADREVQFTLTLGGETDTVTVTLKYAARAGRSGTATLPADR